MSVQNFYDATTHLVTIFDGAGEPHTTTRLNASELVRYNGFSWNHKAEARAETAGDGARVVLYEPVTELPAAIDLVETPLAEIAIIVAGQEDLTKYLAGFTAEALRTLADERYGQRLHHRLAVATLIERITALESEKMAKESTPV